MHKSVATEKRPQWARDVLAAYNVEVYKLDHEAWRRQVTYRLPDCTDEELSNVVIWASTTPEGRRAVRKIESAHDLVRAVGQCRKASRVETREMRGDSTLCNGDQCDNGLLRIIAADGTVSVVPCLCNTGRQMTANGWDCESVARAELTRRRAKGIVGYHAAWAWHAYGGDLATAREHWRLSGAALAAYRHGDIEKARKAAKPITDFFEQQAQQVYGPKQQTRLTATCEEWM